MLVDLRRGRQIREPRVGCSNFDATRAQFKSDTAICPEKIDCERYSVSKIQLHKSLHSPLHKGSQFKGLTINQRNGLKRRRSSIEWALCPAFTASSRILAFTNCFTVHKRPASPCSICLLQIGASVISASAPDVRMEDAIMPWTDMQRRPAWSRAARGTEIGTTHTSILLMLCPAVKFPVTVRLSNQWRRR